jgi:molecular chaperone DnaK
MAKDLGTGKEQSIKITASSGMSKDDIERAVKEAEASAADDKKKREVAEVRNEADTLIYSVEKSLTDYGSKLSDKERAEIQAAVEHTKTAKDGQDIDAIKKAIAVLSKASGDLYAKTTAAQQGQAGAGAAGAPGGDGKPEEKVVEAEFEEVDKDKK